MSVIFLDTEGTNSKLLTGNFPMSMSHLPVVELWVSLLFGDVTLCVRTSSEFHEALRCLLALPPERFLEVSAALRDSGM